MQTQYVTARMPAMKVLGDTPCGLCNGAKILALCFALFFSFKAVAGDTMTYWIDVRTQEEFDAGHVKGAVLIPYEVISDHIAGVTEDKNADIRVYCRSGRRSEVAKDTLKAMGYANVINEGGYQEISSR